MSPSTRKLQAPEKGHITETFAKRFLLKKGLLFVAENVRYKFGEIDLVMREQSHIIFVEVRYRCDTRFGGPVASINATKRSRLQKAAAAWLQSNDRSGYLKCRFDLIALSGELTELRCQWLKNIFQ